MALLVCRHLVKRTEWTVELPAERVPATLGFSARATVPLPDPSLDPIEVTIAPAEDHHILRDVAGKGRVRLGEAITRECPLKDGDIVRVGSIAIRFVETSGAGQEPMLIPRLRPQHAEAEVHGLAPVELEREAEGEAARRPGVAPAVQWFLALVVFAASFAAGLLYTGRSPSQPHSRSLEATRPRVEPQGLGPIPSPAGARAASGAEGAAAAAGRPREALDGTPPPASNASRLFLFHAFLDAARRPPLPEEEAELAGRGPQAVLDAALDAARREGAVPGVLRLPGDASPRPRQPRDLDQRARSWIVDILGRAPASAGEVAGVRAALEAGDIEPAARILAGAGARGRSGDLGRAEIQDLAFRFLLRPLEEEEALAVERLLAPVPSSERRAVLLAALALQDAYATY